MKPAVEYKIEEISITTQRDQLRIGYRIVCTVKYLLSGTNCADQEIMCVGAAFVYSRRMIGFFQKDGHI